ncbi:lengsin-like [Haliotis rubra]|uniref:lengsin-like n=1 Tax=Haliotis rubra TaxID=36100 RepID=UPI001EE545DF|nr:lengsin-like [Haliotis rubra]
MSRLEKVAQEIAKYDYVRFSICDLNGMSRGQVVASRHSKKYLENGLEMFQGILLHDPKTLFLDHIKYNFGSALIVPDLATLRPIPWAPEGVRAVELLCESRWKIDNTPQGACPRYAARKQLQRLDDLGLKFYSSHEIEFQLLDVAKQWIAGILKHSKALSAFASPTVNCYRNFDCQLKPTTPCWGVEDRAACLRIKNEGPLKTYIENRLPTGKCNAYLVAASTIAAGLDGVIKKMECPLPGTSEHDQSLPRSLAEALDELEQDEDLSDALGKELVAWFVQSKRDTEIAKYEDVEADEERFTLEKEDYL